MFFIVYKTVNLINGKYYIGVHKTDNKFDAYLGSGVALNAAIKKYGRDNFKRDIIAELDSYEAAFELEKELVTIETINDPMCYNMTTGGVGSWAHIDFTGDKNPMRKSPETRSKVSESLKRNLANNPKERERRSVWMSQMRKSMAGYRHREETKQKISKSNAGKKWTTEQRNAHSDRRTGYKDTEEAKQNKKLAAQRRMADGFDMGSLGRGKKYKMSERTCPHCNKTGKGGNMTKYHFDNCSYVPNAPKYVEEIPIPPKERKQIIYESVTCPHCQQVGKGGNMTRYHFDNCKKREEVCHSI